MLQRLALRVLVWWGNLTDPQRRDVIGRILRERAVLGGVAVGLVDAWVNGELTRESFLPVLAGLVVRFVVTPTRSAKAKARHARRQDRLDGAANRNPRPAETRR